jgi:hypothetical protein
MLKSCEMKLSKLLDTADMNRRERKELYAIDESKLNRLSQTP